jgi:universal stress protein E
MQIDHLFVVYDPTTEEQLALDRAAVIAANEGSKVHIYTCIHDDTSPNSDEQAGVSAFEVKLDQAAAPLREKGIEVSTEVEWDKDWYSAVVKAAERSGAGAVLKSSRRHSKGQRRLKKTSDWMLIRECSCPVLLVKTAATTEARKVLAALDIRGEAENYGQLNESILSFCQRYIGSDAADVHFINAHKDLTNRPDRGSLVRICGVESDHVHIKMGDPDDVIVENAEELDVNLVVIGNSARSGLSALVKSNTAEKVLDKLQCDLLALT